MNDEPPHGRNDSHKQTTTYFQEHSPLVSIEVTGQDVPQPDDDTMAAVKTSIVDGVFPEKERGRQ